MTISIVVSSFELLANGSPEQSPGVSLGVIIGAGLVALVASLALWPITQFVITIAHEGSHAMTGSMMGAKIDKIEIFRTAGGLTTYRNAGPIGVFLTAMAGYLGPSIFGLAGVMLLRTGHTLAVLSVSLIFLFIALLNMANAVGRIATILVGAVIVLVIRNASAGQQIFFAYAWVWFLLIGGFGHVLVLQNVRRSGPDTSTDAYRLRRLTLLPASLWSGIFWLATLAALIYGGGLLLGVAHLGK